MTMKHFSLAMDMALMIWALTLTFTFWAAWLDWRSRRIPNWLTVSGLLVGIAVHAALGGWHGTLFSLEGAGLGRSLLA